MLAGDGSPPRLQVVTLPLQNHITPAQGTHSDIEEKKLSTRLLLQLIKPAIVEPLCDVLNWQGTAKYLPLCRIHGVLHHNFANLAQAEGLLHIYSRFHWNTCMQISSVHPYYCIKGLGRAILGRGKFD